MSNEPRIFTGVLFNFLSDLCREKSVIPSLMMPIRTMAASTAPTASGLLIYIYLKMLRIITISQATFAILVNYSNIEAGIKVMMVYRDVLTLLVQNVELYFPI